MSGAGTRLLADIGGTRARFALLGADGRVSAPLVLATAGHAGFAAALDEFRAQTRAPRRFDAAAICVAAPVDADEIRLTNSSWVITRAEIVAATGVAAPVLINDFTAVALSLTALGDGELRKLGGGDPRPDKPRGVLGPGTGLGVSALIPDGHGGHVALASEGGHVSLAASDAREREVLARLGRRFEHVSAERVLSGPGLEALHAVLAEIAGVELDSMPSAEAIARLARERASPLAAQTVAMFTRWLGAVAGDLALTLGAHGGIYVAGGIVLAWEDLFDAALFRRGFESKGRYRAYLEPIPTWVVTDPNPALEGLASLLRTETIHD